MLDSYGNKHYSNTMLSCIRTPTCMLLEDMLQHYVELEARDVDIHIGLSARHPSERMTANNLIPYTKKKKLDSKSYAVVRKSLLNGASWKKGRKCGCARNVIKYMCIIIWLGLSFSLGVIIKF